MTEVPGRRERKKAATRQNIAVAARRLFLDRGYDEVGIRDVAAEADVAVTTLFAHFSSKEALVFELDGDFEAQLVRAAADRTAGDPLLPALQAQIEEMLRHCTSPAATPLWEMIDSSPALLDYDQSMRSRHAAALADAIARSEGLDGTTSSCRTIARFVLDSFALARESADPLATVDEVFTMIDAAWQARPTHDGGVA